MQPSYCRELITLLSHLKCIIIIKISATQEFSDVMMIRGDLTSPDHDDQR